ncbi:MAG: HDOD domain-containing protein [Spirochaetales bacterium]|nr:HDOD domain-containing protein [Spirochaetales bacterium]
MDVFVARQPIFDKAKKVIAYELLYRSGIDMKTLQILNGDMATANVAINSFLSIGFKTLTNGKTAFINFTKELLMEEIPTLLPSDSIVIEILEDIRIDDKLVETCKKLKEQKYVIALDDFEFTEYKRYQHFLPYVDILKVDFLLNDRDQIKEISEIMKQYKLSLLAEKVESIEDFNFALECGFEFFQGFFFQKPEILKGKSLTGYKVNHARILQELTRKQPEVAKIAEIVENDPGLTYNLLKLTNSAMFAGYKKLTDINLALMRIGFKELRKWISLIILSDVGKDKPDELLRSSLIRGKLSESIAEIAGLKERKNEAFLLGLFSMIDTMADMTLDALMADLPIEDDVKEALLHKKGPFSIIYDLSIFFEKGMWNDAIVLCRKHNIDINVISDEYVKALDWTKKLNII